MLEHTFCHIPSIGPRSERNLWDAGFHSWDCVFDRAEFPFSQHKADFLKHHVAYSVDKLEAGDPAFFAGGLRSNEHWRIFSDFRDSAAFLDIETTGNGNPRDHITAVTLYDGTRFKQYVYGQNLKQFKEDVKAFKVLITYGGKSFDIPFIRNTMGLPMEHAHIDLRYILASLGYRGGLKGCEMQLGLRRNGLEDVNGYFAVLLWREYRKRKNRRALETLLVYNALDVLHLEPLMVMAYNMKVEDTPFAGDRKLAMPEVPEVPIQPDLELIDRLRQRVNRSRR